MFLHRPSQNSPKTACKASLPTACSSALSVNPQDSSIISLCRRGRLPDQTAQQRHPGNVRVGSTMEPFALLAAVSRRRRPSTHTSTATRTGRSRASPKR